MRPFSEVVNFFFHFDNSIIAKGVCNSGGLSQDFAESGQNRVTAKDQVRAGSSHSAARNITGDKFN